MSVQIPNPDNRLRRQELNIKCFPILTPRMHARHNILNERKTHIWLVLIMMSLRSHKMSDIFHPFK